MKSPVCRCCNSVIAAGEAHRRRSPQRCITAPPRLMALAGQCRFALQEVQLGTGHGVSVRAAPHRAWRRERRLSSAAIPPSCGRKPCAICFLPSGTSRRLYGVDRPDDGTWRYGRIVRDGERILRIVEERRLRIGKGDHRNQQRRLLLLLAPPRRALSQLKNDNDQVNTTSPDVLAAFVAQGLPVAGRWPPPPRDRRRQMTAASCSGGKGFGAKEKGRADALRRNIGGSRQPLGGDGRWRCRRRHRHRTANGDPQRRCIGKDAVIGPSADIAASEIGDGSRVCHSVLNAAHGKALQYRALCLIGAPARCWRIMSRSGILWN